MGGGALILLDTHALLWLDQKNPALGKTARARADAALTNKTVAISALTFWEVALLAQKGRIRLHAPLSDWRQGFLRAGLIELPVDGAIRILAGALDGLPGDPADRLIVATAIANDATLMTADRRLLDWPGELDRHDARS